MEHTPSEIMENAMDADGYGSHTPVDEAVSSRQCIGAGFVRTEDYEERARSVMSGTLRLAPHEPWRTTRVTDWTANPFSSRNWQFQHHTLRWLSPVRFLAADGDEAARDFWFLVVQDWVANNAPENPPSAFSWVDMADGLRAQELVFGWPLAANDAERELLITTLRTHGQWLAEESHQATGNHALHQNIGLFVLASFLRAHDWQRLAVSRMEALFLRSFDHMGANDEGSPDYHRMNLAWWRSAWDRVALEGMEVPAAVASTLSRAATFLAHLTRPDGTLVPLGDTHLKQVTADGWPELEYVASLGDAGEPPRTTVVAAPNGYVLGRSGWGDDERSFSEHSHYSMRYGNHLSPHHHEDRGSLTFFTGGQDWLTDPGSYMYEPKDPFRKYLRSREAHNLVTVEGREYDPSARVQLTSCDTSDAAHDFTVTDPGYVGVTITRRVVYFPPLDLLVVLDRVQADKNVTAVQRWHTEPGIKPRYRDSALELQKRDGSRFTITWLAEGARPRVHYGDDGSVREWVSRRWGRKEAAAGFDVAHQGKNVFFAAVMGDSTDNSWAVASSRAKPDATWLRLIRHGVVWEVTIDSEGARATVEQTDDSSTNQPSASARAIAAVTSVGMQQRLTFVEQQLAMVTARAAESDSANAGVQEQLAATRRRVSVLEESLVAGQTREKQHMAAFLALLPAGTDPHLGLGGLSLRTVAPYINDPLYLHEVWCAHREEVVLNLGRRRRLARELHQRGYLSRSIEVLHSLAAVTGKDDDLRLLRIRESELAMMRGSVELTASPGEGFSAQTGRILHVVGKALPETQTGYTLRTHYLASAQVERGYDVHVMRQVGAVTEPHGTDVLDLDGVGYHLPQGPTRGSVPWQEWLQANVDALRQLVLDLRPSVLHCHSDFINQMVARPVARAFGIPLVYESRGFWEESWLSRIETTVGRALDADYRRYGMPEAYTLRQAREDQARAESDRVTTLADVMKEHIVARGLDDDRVCVAPNGVAPSEFPVVEVNCDLKSRLEIPAEAPVIGYITSVVEYEGIDTLVRAFARLRATGEDVWLLIVGDGPVRASLVELARDLGVGDRAVFTGRVPHEDVLEYYSVIDLFVVPRKNRTVCRLVTPLKPFEAFSTGRTVILSDVDALREIAQDSGAAELFEADNADSLAGLLHDLLADPDRRADLATRGAQWAREFRSWDAIAGRYDAPYTALGVCRFRSLDEDPHQLTTPAEAAQRRANSPVSNRASAVKLLQLHGADGIPTGAGAARATMTTGWSAYGFDPVPMSLPVEWEAMGPEDRSWRMHLHCWEFMHAPLSQWAETGDENYLQWCVDRALSWAGQFPHITDSATMAWYDMAIAYRTMVLVTLLRAASVSTAMTNEQYRALLELSLRHRDAHWAETSFNPRNNHGYYAAVSQIVLGRELADLPGMTALRHQGEERLRVMTRGQFLPDGGHSEHSPDYHRMLLEGFDAALAADLIEDPAVARVITSAANALGWMVQPDGCLVQFGDSAQRAMVGKGLRSSSDTTQWVLSAGRQGRPAEETMLALPQTGYVFVREPAPATPEQFRESSYLAFTSAFHSRAHKHCDDNTMVWFEAGQQILVDGGRYRYGDLLPSDSPLRAEGFYYADPMRQFMESCQAHSTVSLDSALHDRRRNPHGSGIISSRRSPDGSYVIEATTPHKTWTHDRRVRFAPGRELEVVDRVSCRDAEGHDMFLWWHVDGSLELTRSATELVFSSARWPDRFLKMSFNGGDDMSVVRGSHDPLGGWRSRKDRTTEESWSVRVRIPMAVEQRVVTSMLMVPRTADSGKEQGQ